MLSVARLVSFWRCIPVHYNCQKSSNFQGLSHFSRIFGKNDRIPGFFQAGKTVTIFPGFPGAVGTLCKVTGIKATIYLHIRLLFHHITRMVSLHFILLNSFSIKPQHKNRSIWIRSRLAFCYINS